MNFLIDNDFTSCVASLNNKMIQISTHYHNLVFVLRKYSKTLIQQCRNQTIFRKQSPEPLFWWRGEKGKVFFVLQKCTETHLQQCRINKFFRGLHPGTPVLGKEKFVFVLRKCSNTLLCIAMQNSMGVRRGEQEGANAGPYIGLYKEGVRYLEVTSIVRRGDRFWEGGCVRNFLKMLI